MTNEEKLEQARAFVFTLLHQIPRRKLDENRIHIVDTKTGKDEGSIQEYINNNLNDIWGIKIVW